MTNVGAVFFTFVLPVPPPVNDDDDDDVDDEDACTLLSDKGLMNDKNI
jgi:hypothetical protein